MNHRKLGTSDLTVSALCLGTMTWGSQNSEAEAHRQIDIALDRGITFIDTAEMYPTNPVRLETIGRTEEIIGNWIARSGRRGEFVLATKIAGAGQKARGGAPITGPGIRQCVADSLRRLRTDHIDLYQLHVPNRGTWAFRRHWSYAPWSQDSAAVQANMTEVMTALAEEVAAGRVRHFGLSNETAWGVMAWNRAAEATGGPRVQTVQNEYNLMCRHCDLDLAEVSHHEKVHLLAFSPIAAGLLSGKYKGGGLMPPGSRLALSPAMGGRVTPAMWTALEAYLAIARRHGLDPAQMALAFTLTRPFLGAAIFGATSEAQLETALGAADLALSPEVLAEIDGAHRAHAMPY